MNLALARYVVEHQPPGLIAAGGQPDRSRMKELGLHVMMINPSVEWITWLQLTRPLRSLTDELRSFRDEAAALGDCEPGDEIGVLRRAVRAMQSRIAQQFQRLEDGDRQRRELLSNISHDLRTPLSSIQGYVETVLLRGETLDAATRANHLRTALRHGDLLGSASPICSNCPNWTRAASSRVRRCSAWPSCCRTWCRTTGSPPSSAACG